MENFLFAEMHLKYRLRNNGHLVQGEMSLGAMWIPVELYVNMEKFISMG